MRSDPPSEVQASAQPDDDLIVTVNTQTGAVDVPPPQNPVGALVARLQEKVMDYRQTLHAIAALVERALKEK